MATTITYALALTTIKNFAIEKGFNDKDVIDKIDKLIAQKTTKSKSGTKSKARETNEKIARDVAKLMIAKNVTEIRASWVRDNMPTVASVPKAVAVLNAATEEGILIQKIIKKSPTRNEFVYTLPENREPEDDIDC